jgi:hypothetical protein
MRSIGYILLKSPIIQRIFRIILIVLMDELFVHFLGGRSRVEELSPSQFIWGSEPGAAGRGERIHSK